MKIIRFDSVGGASGDMILGALVGLGVDVSHVQRELESLDIGPFKIDVKPFESHGITGVQAHVHADTHTHHHDAHHDHRGLTEIVDIIRGSKLPERVKAQSVEVFTRMGEIEAKIHGTTIDKIHFHEIGAVDSIVDIVGSCLALHLLGVDRVVVGPLPIGHGVIECAHGVYPSPAPATAELLKGARVVDVDEPFELVTPTGAALLTTWPGAQSVPAGSRIVRTAHSFGHRALKQRPNLLRALLFESGVDSAASESCHVLECNLDDATPEIIGTVMERLLAEGALDAFTTAVQMKKQRPGVLLTVLCDASRRDALLDLIFRESTTFGVREYEASRTVLARRSEAVQTAYGSVRVKIGHWRGSDVTISPEMEDCIRLAGAANVPVRAVYLAAQIAGRDLRRQT